MSELGEFQKAFSRALLDEPGSVELGAGLNVHRNTVLKGLIDALEANYPTVARLVGREWFRACAAEYARRQPPRSAALVLYGETFSSFLSQFEPAAELPYLPEVARIDRLWIEAHTAADEVTRFGWFEHSAVAIWIHQRSADPQSELEVDDTAEGIVLTRPVGAVEYQRLDRAEYIGLVSGRTK